MTLPIYAIKDELNGYNAPYVMSNQDVAKRDFREKLLLNQSMMITPEDFSLWQIGTYETISGEIKVEKNVHPILIERGQRHGNDA